MNVQLHNEDGSTLLIEWGVGAPSFIISDEKRNSREGNTEREGSPYSSCTGARESAACKQFAFLPQGSSQVSHI